ncbi:MAG: hypothetical protein DBX41_06415 [Clostridiales bacterium]|nr:MAG: hypothetical protein DBX41_06415 [Clostridiales bacterium]
MHSLGFFSQISIVVEEGWAMRLVCFRLMLYSFGGWLLEGLYQLLMTGSFWKPNFLLGPFKPMYGIASVLLLAVRPLGKRAFFFFAQVIPLGVEFVSAWWLKAAFGLQYWDYSAYKYNVAGFICLQFAVFWVVLSYAFAYFLQPKLAKIKFTERKVTKGAVWFLWAGFLSDIFYTIITAWGG